MQEGGNPAVPVYGLVDGACGYGAFDQNVWPYWHVAALSFSNPVSAAGQPQQYGCGACIEVSCQGSVRAAAQSCLGSTGNACCTHCPPSLHQRSSGHAAAAEGKGGAGHAELAECLLQAHAHNTCHRPPLGNKARAVWRAQTCTGKGPVTVLVADTCKDCEPYQINMNAATFEAYMATSTGYIGVSWQQAKHSAIPCASCMHAGPP